MTIKNALIIGGGSGIGLAVADLLLAEGTQVTIAGRSADRLAAAARGLDRPGLLRTTTVDVADEDRVRHLFDAVGPVDHVVVTAVDAAGAYAPVVDFDLENARRVLDAKVLGALRVAKHAAGRLGDGGSITFVSGIAAHRPGPGGAAVAAANGALEALTRALALELAPVRVNTVSPGWTDTPAWDVMAGAGKAQRLAAMADRLPVGRVAQPADIAAAIVAMVANGFITGSVLHVDGGHRLV